MFVKLRRRFRPTWLRKQIDPTMFKYYQKEMENELPRICLQYGGNLFSNDLIYLFDENCPYCGKYTCDKTSKKEFDNIVNEKYNILSSLKNIDTNKRIIYVFKVNPSKFYSYDDFYRRIIIHFDKLFIADYIILYGLEKRKVKVIKCIDNISLGVKYTPKYINPRDCIIPYDFILIKKKIKRNKIKVYRF